MNANGEGLLATILKPNAQRRILLGAVLVTGLTWYCLPSLHTLSGTALWGKLSGVFLLTWCALEFACLLWRAALRWTGLSHWISTVSTQINTFDYFTYLGGRWRARDEKIVDPTCAHNEECASENVFMPFVRSGDGYWQCETCGHRIQFLDAEGHPTKDAVARKMGDALRNKDASRFGKDTRHFKEAQRELPTTTST